MSAGRLFTLMRRKPHDPKRRYCVIVWSERRNMRHLNNIALEKSRMEE